MSDSEQVAIEGLRSELLVDLIAYLRELVREGSMRQDLASTAETEARRVMNRVASAHDFTAAVKELRTGWRAIPLLDAWVGSKALTVAAFQVIAENQDEILSDLKATAEASRQAAAAKPLSHVFLREDLGLQVLYGIFESALLSPSFHEDNRLRIEDGGTGCWLFIADDLMRFACWYSTRTSVSQEAKLRNANLVNENRRIVRASVDEDGDLALDWYVSLQGGLTKHQIVSSGKSFLAAVRAALAVVEEILS